MTLRRWRLAGGREHQMVSAARVVEPELDMHRPVQRQFAIALGVLRLIKWLMPQSNVTGAPMRSVARELEEAFPSSDN